MVFVYYYRYDWLLVLFLHINLNLSIVWFLGNAARKEKYFAAAAAGVVVDLEAAMRSGDVDVLNAVLVRYI